ncbi:hypothetical protein H4S06_003153 [Coemansia sp. BCRC 34490]|nr:hypothetical protein LPJ72_003724 [Coemansia sp. Benny D160-2]KAJ2757502.1 hypothetical protein H4S06_003153 [Coemansia sp. BCRC 34490]
MDSGALGYDGGSSPYYKAGGGSRDDGSWAITRFLRNEVFDSQKLVGNLNVLYGAGVFAGAVYFVEKYGELLIQ